MNTKSIIFSSLIISFSFFSTHATDTITTTQILRDNGESLVSSTGRFELGFYGPKNSENRYVGIWYHNLVNQTVVWVANHENPLKNTLGTLTVIEPGVLVLQNSNNSTIWSTNTSTSVQTPVAVLLNSGNLVVKDENDDREDNFLWQSFEYPTDTFLPGMKLGKNFVTGKEVYIRSPKSEDDPASGDYTFTCDPTGYPQMVEKQGGLVKVRSGPWNGKGFSGAPILQRNDVFTYGVVMSEKEVYYHFDMLNDSFLSRFVLDGNGDGSRLNWVERQQEWVPLSKIPRDICDTYNKCGPYGSCSMKNSALCGCLDRFKPSDHQGWEIADWSNGCVRNTPLNCGKGDGFKKYRSIKLPDTRSSSYNESMGLEECKKVCLKNCSCMGYASLDVSRGDSGCLLWFDDLLDIREIDGDRGQDMFIRMASSDSDAEGGNHEALIIALSVTSTICILVICLLFLYFRKRKNQDDDDDELQETDTSRLDNSDIHQDEIHTNKDMELPLFDLATIMRATDSFSLENKLGQGGFGPVYKAQLDDGQEVAVKRLSRTSLQGAEEFKNEVMCIAKLQHRNLVKLLGCCIEGEEKMLVYEYMTNRSLDLILFHPVNKMLLDWPRRCNIINGIARGLMYLHQDSRLRVIHRDLKASNILLDLNMNPKISDFGLARTFLGDETGANTSRVIGTYGYMSPEYAVDGQFSVKSDVFSFGVLALEIVSGKRNRGSYQRDGRVNLLGQAWMLYKEENSMELIDSFLRNSCNFSEVIRLVHIGLLCVQELPGDRPTMSSVVLMLSNGSVLPEAKHPGFFTGRDLLKYESSGGSNTSCSTNVMTITLPEGR